MIDVRNMTLEALNHDICDLQERIVRLDRDSKQEKVRLQEKIAQLQKAIEILKLNPELEFLFRFMQGDKY